MTELKEEMNATERIRAPEIPTKAITRINGKEIEVHISRHGTELIPKRKDSKQ